MKGFLAVLLIACLLFASTGSTWARPARLYRTEGKDAMIGGVAGGLAEYFDIDPTLVRVVWAAAALACGFGVVLYILFWWIAPTKSQVITNQA